MKIEKEEESKTAKAGITEPEKVALSDDALKQHLMQEAAMADSDISSNEEFKYTAATTVQGLFPLSYTVQSRP